MAFYEKMSSWLEDPGIENFDGLDMRKLDMDQAYVVAETSLENIRLYAASDDCHRCPYELLHTMRRGSAKPWVVSTVHALSWRLIKGSSEKYISTENRTGLVCEMRPELGEFGVYHLNLTTTDCRLTTASEPVDIHLPLILAAMFFGALIFIYVSLNLLISCFKKKKKMIYEQGSLVVQPRLRALDTFRGIIIVLMIFVNCGGGHYQRWMSHATWNGLNVADLVFPCFVWIMGFCIPLSTRGVMSKGVPSWKAFVHIVKRSFLLFFLGVCLHTVFGDNWLGSMRVMGVLQRLAIGYLVVASVYLFTASSPSCGQKLKEFRAVAWCWVLAATFFALHTYITYRVHDPDCPPLVLSYYKLINELALINKLSLSPECVGFRVPLNYFFRDGLCFIFDQAYSWGYLGPGGRHDNWVAPAKCAGGAAGYLDLLILGESHIYPELSITIVYGANSIDPENILGSLTTIVHVVLGVHAGATLLQHARHRSRLARWLAVAALQGALGGALAGFSSDYGLVPINKNLWSISFVLVLSAISSLFLSICYLLTDVWNVWSGEPFRAPGRNAIFLYVAHTLGDFSFPFRWRVLRMRTHAIFLVENLWATALWLIVAHVMARKKMFVTL